MRCCFAFDGEVRRDDHFPHLAVIRALEQTVKVYVPRTDAIERGQSAHQHEIKSLIALGLFHHHHIRRCLNHA
jgi:hypothetical protein